MKMQSLRRDLEMYNDLQWIDKNPTTFIKRYQTRSGAEHKMLEYSSC